MSNLYKALLVDVLVICYMCQVVMGTLRLSSNPFVPLFIHPFIHSVYRVIICVQYVPVRESKTKDVSTL